VSDRFTRGRLRTAEDDPEQTVPVVGGSAKNNTKQTVRIVRGNLR